MTQAPTVEEFIALLESQLGKPYVYGGESPLTGFDCSGLGCWAAYQLGISIPRTTQAMYSALEPCNGTRIGDFVFFDVPADGPPQPQHVGYVTIVGHQMIEAPHTGTVVRFQAPIPNSPSESIMGYRRVPQLATTPLPPPQPQPTTKDTTMSIAIAPTGKVHIERVSPTGHLLHFVSGESTAPGGWAVTDVTDAIASIADGQLYTVQA